MRIPSNVFRLFILTLTLCMAGSSFADEIVDTTGNKKVPFGIRDYDIGLAHNFTLHDVDGEKFELEEARGGWVFLHFWASWCGPCQEEMPAIQKLADAIKSKKFQIVMINTAEDEDTIFEFLAAIDVELNSLMDVDGLVTEAWKPRGLPTTFLISPKGEIRYQAVGGRDWGKAEYVDFIRQLIKSTP